MKCELLEGFAGQTCHLDCCYAFDFNAWAGSGTAWSSDVHEDASGRLSLCCVSDGKGSCYCCWLLLLWDTDSSSAMAALIRLGKAAVHSWQS
jgi:hypothetical protein